MKKGTKVVVVLGYKSAVVDDWHNFKEGTVVYSTGGVWNSSSEWLQFEDPITGEIQYLKRKHYKVLEEPKDSEDVDTGAQSVVSSKLPSKKVYAVYDNNGLLAITRDRDFARQVKAENGGKRAGVVIIKYAAVKEIR